MSENKRENPADIEDLDRTEGLRAYVESKGYRRALGLPAESEGE